MDIECRFAEKQISTVVFQRQQRTGDRAETLRGHVAVLCGIFRPMLGHIAEYRAQILHVDQRQVMVVRNPEYRVQYALLNLRQTEDPRKEGRA